MGALCRPVSNALHGPSGRGEGPPLQEAERVRPRRRAGGMMMNTGMHGGVDAKEGNEGDDRQGGKGLARIRRGW